MRALAIISVSTTLFAVASCGPAPQAIDQNNSQSDSNEVFVPQFPQNAAPKDKALMAEWMTQNDACVGGQDSKPCDVRERLTDRLRKRGWCWGAPLSKSAVGNDWHHCGDYDTDNLTDDGTASSGPIKNDWITERERPKSPLLQVYENAVEPLYWKMGLAKIVLECGIRGQAWHQQTVAALEAFSRQPQFEEMRVRLTVEDAGAATRFKQFVIDGAVKLFLGDGKASSCSTIANAPFVQNEATFLP